MALGHTGACAEAESERRVRLSARPALRGARHGRLHRCMPRGREEEGRQVVLMLGLFAGAELAGLVNDAALLAVRAHRSRVHKVSRCRRLRHSVIEHQSNAAQVDFDNALKVCHRMHLAIKQQPRQPLRAWGHTCAPLTRNIQRAKKRFRSRKDPRQVNAAFSGS